MFQKILNLLVIAVLLAGFSAAPAKAQPIETDPLDKAGLVDDVLVAKPRAVKPLDQPNMKDYLRLREYQRLVEAGQQAQANALAQTGTDRVLVVLADFAGTDVLTWTEGQSDWDPYGHIDPAKVVELPDGTVDVGNCSNIITQTKTFTYTPLLHNMIPRPPSTMNGVWNADNSKEWFENFMFKNGVVISYTGSDNKLVYNDFTGKSVANYYKDFSSGTYTVTGDVVGWVALPHSYMYYGADQCPGRRSADGYTNASTIRSSTSFNGAGGTRGLVRDALDAVNKMIDEGQLVGFDWHNYDQDGDGIIDRLWIVHAGLGEEDKPDWLNMAVYGENAVWSHSSSVTPVYSVTNDVAAGPYIMMPENGGIGVFAHEYGHNLGADDLYAYVEGNPSVGFWSLMDDDWTGYPIGFQPPSVDPWHLDNWGWLHPMVITDVTKTYEFKIGQASNYPGGENMYRGGKIVLPTGQAPLSVPVWQGSYYWFGGKADLMNSAMTSKNPIAIPAGTVSPTLSFDLSYNIEQGWDFLWIQASTDKRNWDTLTNAETVCDHDPSWIGGLYGFPDDLCAANLGGFSGANATFPTHGVQSFDLSKYVGQSIYLRFWYMTDWGTSLDGSFVDQVKVGTAAQSFFSDDAEAGDANWTYSGEWVRSTGFKSFSQNFYLQWRNVNNNGGYDNALGDARFRYGPANTGLLVWYNNNYYTDNEIFNYLTDWPSYGPKGRMLVVEAHGDPYRDPYWVAQGYNNEGGNTPHRGLMRDAPFTVVPTVDFTQTTGVYSPTHFAGRPAVTGFHDALGYYPGAEYVSRGPSSTTPVWVTKQWDASAVMPATQAYPLKAPGYQANEVFRFDCSKNLALGRIACYGYGSGLGVNGGTGNPGDTDAQFGWHVEVTEEAADHTWAKVKVWNSMIEVKGALQPSQDTAQQGDVVTYTYHLNQNQGSKLDALMVFPVDTSRAEYVPGSAFGGVVLATSLSPEAVAATFAEGGLPALEKAAREATGQITTLVWNRSLASGDGNLDFGFAVRILSSSGKVSQSALLFADGISVQTYTAPSVWLPTPIYIPTVAKLTP